MPVKVEGFDAIGTLHLNEDGTLSFFKDGTSNEEILTEEQAIQRWPQLRESIIAAVKRLPG